MMESDPPQRRNIQGKWILSDQKVMIVNMYKDMKSRSPKKPYKQLIAEISGTSGIGHNSVSSIIAEYRNTGTVSSPNKTRSKKCLFDKIDDLDRNALRQKVHSFWLRKELPTVDKILRAVNDDPALPDFRRTTLYSTIKKLDFVFTKRKRCSVLTERDDLLLRRQNYLSDVRRYRNEGRTVYYVDETWIMAYGGGGGGGAATNLQPTAEGKRLIALHVGSRRGFVDGGLLCFASRKNSADYREEIDGRLFHGWLESVLPRLDANSVIVMDNAPGHSVRTEKVPTSRWKKMDISSWLTSKGVAADGSMFRAQLLAKVREIKGEYASYVADRMAEDAGHTVLRLPPNHCELNPMELAWAMVKGHVKQRSNDTSGGEIDDVNAFLNAAIERVAGEDWQSFVEHVVTEENRLSEVDANMDELIDGLEPCATAGDTSDSDCD